MEIPHAYILSTFIYTHTHTYTHTRNTHRGMESWKPKVITNYNHKASGCRSRAINAPCKKHPRHRQSPGVCSICLNEKLSQLSNPNHGCSSTTAKLARSQYSSSSSSSYVSSLSSSNASSCSSPVVSSTRRMDSDAMKSMRVFKKAGQNVLKKSRSMAFVSRRLKEEDENGKKTDAGNKGGFWSKLLPRRSRGLMHSRTMRERVITAVH